MDPFLATRIFGAVVDARRLLRAANAPGRFKAAVSRQVEEPEACLGNRVLNRTMRHLTQSGLDARHRGAHAA